ETAYYSDVAASDWSWGALLFDADNDRKNDIYVCNGIHHDVIDQDFIDFFADEVNQKMALSGQKEKYENIIKNMPSRPIVNQFFHNKGDFRFDEEGETFGFTKGSFSNGAAYGDLDNDGDLDLVVNNVNQDCYVYKNTIEKEKNNFLKIEVKGPPQNTFGIGTTLKLYLNSGEILTKTIHCARGFQSSSEYPVLFGLGKDVKIDSLNVFWPNDKIKTLKTVKSNTKINIVYAETDPKVIDNKPLDLAFFTPKSSNLDTTYQNEYADFYFEKNIPFRVSNEGLKTAQADVNGDGKVDLFVCGARDQASKLYLQSTNGFVLKENKEFQNAAFFEDTYAVFFDADKDGDQDLYVATGGNENAYDERLYVDRLYTNDGKGNFTITIGAVPYLGYNIGVLCPKDIDSDGDLDVFVGARSYPKEYGKLPTSFILKNDGKGNFQIAQEIPNKGLIRDAVWKDLDGDKIEELIVVGDWQYPQVFKIKNKKVVENETNLTSYSGFWSSVKAEDLDADGDMDLVLGNIGQNLNLHASNESPLKLFVGDFDKNQMLDKIFTKTAFKNDSPYFLKREMMEQFPILKKTSLKHSEYAEKSIYDLFERSTLEAETILETNYLKSCVALNDGKGNFQIIELPFQAQWSNVSSLVLWDINKDKKLDIICGGNSDDLIPQIGRLDACKGRVFINKGKGVFQYIPNLRSGLYFKGSIRDLQVINLENVPTLIATAINQEPQLYTLNNLKK
ncbi:MAG: FG-GAP-like repeat-containing protein, partial [Leadbetterella sp.]